MRLACILFLTTVTTNVWPESWAVLPVRSVGIKSNQVSSGPLLLPNRNANSIELAKLMTQYMRLAGLNSVVPSHRIEKAYRKLRLKANQKVTRRQLQSLAIQLDSEHLLFSSAIRTRQGFQIESQVYYANSGSVSDNIITRHPDFWQLLTRHLHQRFEHLSLPPTIRNRSDRPLIVVLDASGSNYSEIAEMRKIVRLVDTRFSAICSVNRNGKFSFASMGDHPARISSFLKKLSPRGGKAKLVGFDKALRCAIKNNPYRGRGEDRPRVLVLVGSAPASPSEESRISSSFRKLAVGADVLVVGSGALSSAGQQFWSDLAAAADRTGSARFENIIYRQNVGLASGESWYVFKRGNQLLENTAKIPRKNSHGITVPAHLRARFSAKNMLSLYKKLSRNQVIESGKVSMLLQDQVLKFTGHDDEIATAAAFQGSRVRVLVEIQRKPFWINLPRSQVFDSSGKQRLKTNDSYYFLLNLARPEKGIPFTNTPGFARVYHSRKHVSRLWLLSIEDYLAKPKRYLNRSMGGTSVYTVFAKVKLVRVTEKDVMDF